MQNKKSDPRVRFQRSNFTRKLDVARNYKRTSRPKPDDRTPAGLEKAGLATLLPQLLLASVLIIGVYLLYVPSPLFVQTVRIEGLNSEYQSLAREAVKSYLDASPWYFPANNILFLNAAEMARAVDEQVPAISKIEGASKSFRDRTLVVSVVQKYERYMVVRPEDKLVLYNDGTLKEKMTKKAGEGPMHSGAVVSVIVNHSAPVENGELYFDPLFLDLVEQSATLFPQLTGQNFAYAEVKLPEGDSSLSGRFSESWKKANIAAVVDKKPVAGGKNNPSVLKVIIEPGLDIAMAADRLKLLLDQTAPDRYRNLYYADLRLPNRAYLCLINTPCASNNP